MNAMKKLYTILFAISLSLGLIVIAQAQDPTQTPGTRTPVIKKRQQIQKHRVRQGVRSGELTAKETGKLANEVKENKDARVAAKADGTVTGAERKAILKNQNQTSHKIYRAKHNNKTRP